MKSLNLYLKKITYSGADIGSDLTFSFFFDSSTFSKSIKVKHGTSIDLEESIYLQRIFRNESIQVFFEVVEKDPSKSDKGGGVGTIDVSYNKEEPQTFTLRGYVAENSSDDIRKVAVFTIELEARLEMAVQKKWLLVDSTDLASGIGMSLDAEFDVEAPLSSHTSDLVFSGRILLPSGEQRNYRLKMAPKYAAALSLRPVAGKPGVYHYFAGNDPQPLADPFEITLHERTVKGTEVERVSGQIYNPATDSRTTFTITHDPAPIVVVAIVGGAVALICGAILVVQALINDCVAQANSVCGEGNVESVTVEMTFGFSWGEGSPEIGCSSDCKITCKESD